MLSCVASAVLVFPLSLHVALPIYGRAGGEAALQFAVRQIVRVPELFGNHAALVGEFLDGFYEGQGIATGREFVMADRKSTRLNSSHLVISYAVFCTKKKSRRRRHL